MKIASLLLSLLPLLAICTANDLLSADDQQPQPDLDIGRDKLQTGVNYYILPVICGQGGGLTLGGGRTSTCPHDVVQERKEIKKGLPVKFLPVRNTKGLVSLSTDLNIKFTSVSEKCVESPVWKLDNFDESAGEFFVTTGGVEGKPGPESISNWFKIEKIGDDYKLVFCPTVCDICKVICKDVGIVMQNGVQHLALSDTPFRVMFSKA